jgi:hypothetical protein
MHPAGANPGKTQPRKQRRPPGEAESPTTDTLSRVRPQLLADQDEMAALYAALGGSPVLTGANNPLTLSGRIAYEYEIWR